MVDKYSGELYDAVVELGKPAKLSTVTGGQAAGQLIADLMRNAQKKLPPKKIIDTYIEAGGKKNSTTFKALYGECGDQTAQLWLMGASTLAALWESAWEEGKGSKLPKRGIREYQPDELMELYQDPDFLKSYYLADIKEALAEAPKVS